MNKNDAINMNVIKVEQNLIEVTRLYMRMHGGSVPSSDEDRESAKKLIQSLAKDVIEYVELYPSLLAESNSSIGIESAK